MGMMERIDSSIAAPARECLSFQLGGEEYGIDILAVQEIRAYERPTRIANAPEGVAPLWLEQLVFEKLAGRKIATVASAQVRQALFELGVTAVSREMLPQLAAKLRVDAFVDASVGSAGRKNYGAIATPIYGGSVIASPIETNRGAVEITFISANSAKMLMHGVASGESGWRSQKGVIGTMFDQMFDKVFTPQFYVEYTPEFVNEWMKSQPVK